MSTIIFDIDDVMFDTVGTWMEEYSKLRYPDQHSNQIDKFHITEWDVARCVGDKGVYGLLGENLYRKINLRPYRDMAWLVNVLAYDGHKIKFVTARPTESSAVTVLGLKTYCGLREDEFSVLFSNNKSDIEADAIIDDKVETLLNYKHDHPGSVCIKMVRPHNLKPMWNDDIENAWDAYDIERILRKHKLTRE